MLIFYRKDLQGIWLDYYELEINILSKIQKRTVLTRSELFKRSNLFLRRIVPTLLVLSGGTPWPVSFRSETYINIYFPIFLEKPFLKILDRLSWTCPIPDPLPAPDKKSRFKVRSVSNPDRLKLVLAELT